MSLPQNPKPRGWTPADSTEYNGSPYPAPRTPQGHSPDVRIVIVNSKRLWQAYCPCGWRSTPKLRTGAVREADWHRGE